MKGYRDNVGGGGGFGARSKTVYDDVFGGPPKFGATTLPPRLEDYTEIFQGFHASRGSSIPVLDLPPAAGDSDDVWFDVRSSKLDYSEVFGGFNGLDFAVSYEELFKSSKVGDDDSSDDVWTPAQSESLSDESDPYATLEMNQQVPITNPNKLFGVKSQNEPNLEAEKDVLNEMTNDPQILDCPSKIEDDNFISLDNNDLCANKDIGGISEGKQLKKSFSQPLEKYASDPSNFSGNLKGYLGNKPLFSVSNLGLKTQPSHLPPPSRPPPSITTKKGDFGNFNSKLKTSKSYAFERMTTGDRSPPYFDVEIDASSSAAADAAAMKDAVEQAQAKLKSAKELMDKKKDKKSKVNDGFERSNGFSSVTKHEVNRKNEKDSVILEPDVSPNGSNKNDKTVLESFEQKEDCNIVQERETEKRFFVSQQDGEIRAPNDSDENEFYENLIEIQLKDNDMENVEKVVTENWLKYDNGKKEDDMGPASCIWEDYDVGLIENEKFKVLKEAEKNDEKEFFQQSSPPEISTIQSEEEEERIVKDSFELEESDNMAETIISEQEENIKEEFLDNNEKIYQEEFTQEEEKLEKDCNSEENIKLEDCESEEIEKSEKGEEIISENDEIEKEQEGIKWDENESITEEISESSDVVFQVDDDNEILEASGNVHQDNEKVEETVEQIHEVSEELFSNLQGVKVEVKTEDITDSKLSNENPVKPPTENGKKTCEINKNREKEERLQRAKDLENERLRKLEEERERQIEREKDRMAVDRATLEARERAFAETKERTERAAVERATAEFRQRALAEARERLEKACAEARERSLAEKANEGRLRVEKATAEARERAEKSVGDKFFNYQNSGMRQNSLPADLGRSYSGLRYSQTAVQSGGEGESPQRCKARLERHQRTADRAAKALAEKNMRDLIAQKEQTERSRLAESLDAEVKRWSSGKQGNLRALLSTLQYILGSDSGWQPVPLTEVITTAAVKKAYRKATLCVHPDKLQQRGATIQQKYICEKVFDLLKEAWNKFNSEER